MTDAQIEAAARALVECTKLSEAKWSDLPDWAKEECRGVARAALESAEKVAHKDRWYADEECSFESPDDAAESACLSLGESIVLSENVSFGEERWQMAPVTYPEGELCPCGKPEGCDDFLGMECKADRGEVRRWADLPKEWQR